MLKLQRYGGIEFNRYTEFAQDYKENGWQKSGAKKDLKWGKQQPAKTKDLKPYVVPRAI